MLSSAAINLFNIFFPNTCTGCGNSLSQNEKSICLTCLEKLPQTHYHKTAENPIVQKFWGRVPLEFAAAFYFQNKNNITQRLIHQLKYKGKKAIGNELGEIIGYQLQQENTLFPKIDAIIPLPLHPAKEQKRGYNQCQFIADGIAAKLNIPVYNDAVARVVANVSQTQKDKFGRWENVAGIFTVTKPEKIKSKQLLLIDDVVTTGSTIESCATAILSIPDTKLSVLTLAFPQE